MAANLCAQLPTIYCSLFNFLEGLTVKYASEDFNKTLSHMCFVDHIQESLFAWKVILYVLSLFTLFPVVFRVTLW